MRSIFSPEIRSGLVQTAGTALFLPWLRTTGWTDDFAFAFAHKAELCSPFRKRVPDPTAPYDAYDESDDTEEAAKAGYLKSTGR